MGLKDIKASIKKGYAEYKKSRQAIKVEKDKAAKNAATKKRQEAQQHSENAKEGNYPLAYKQLNEKYTKDVAAAEKQGVKTGKKGKKRAVVKASVVGTVLGAGTAYGYSKYDSAKKSASDKKKTPGKTTFTDLAAKSPSAKPYKSEAMNKNYSKNVENSRKVQINQTANEINRAKVTSSAQKIAENRRKVEANKKKVAPNKVAVTAAKAKKKK